MAIKQSGDDVGKSSGKSMAFASFVEVADVTGRSSSEELLSTNVAFNGRHLRPLVSRAAVAARICLLEGAQESTAIPVAVPHRQANNLKYPRPLEPT